MSALLLDLLLWQTWTATNSDGSGAGSLQIDGSKIADAITAKYIAGLDAIVGQTYYLVRHGSPWQTDRMFDRPDDDSIFKGWNSSGGISTAWTPNGQTPTNPATEYSFLLDATGTPVELYTPFAYLPDEFKGQELLVFGGDKLRRVTILGNDDKHLYFAKQTWTAGGCYRIVMPGSKGTPGRKILPLVQFYTGIATQNATHLADDSTGFWDQAAFTIPVYTGDNCVTPPSCSNDYPIVLDSDYRYPPDNTCNCGTAGEYLSPNLYKSIRMMQQTCLNMCGAFVDPSKSYSGAGAIPTFCPATYFNRMGINSWTSGYDRNDDGTLLIGGLPDDVDWPKSVYYALIYPLGNISCGGGSLAADGTLAGSFPAHDDSNPNNNPGSVVLSLGYTRYRPRRLRFLYPKTTWQPNCDDDDGCIDPAGTTVDDDTGALDCFGVGTWIKRPKSGQYMVRGVTGLPSDVGGEFTDDDLARYVGDNAADTCIVPQIGPSADTALLDSIPFWDRFYRGNLAYKNQLERDKSRVGTATGGSGQRVLTDTGKNWWSDYTNGSFTQKSRASISSVVPYTPATLTTPEVYGSATTPVTPPRPVVDSSWTVTDDTDASGSGNVLLTGTYSFTSSSSPVTIPGEFMANMTGKTITFTFHGAMHIESGTATGGSGSTLVDTTKNTADHTIETGCWWDAGRFINFASGSGSGGSGSGVGGAFVDFILKIVRNGSGGGSGSGSQQEWRAIITGVTNNGAGGVIVHFALVDGLTVQSGDVYSIEEPAYEINKWEDRYCALTSPDGTVYEGHISHSDDVTLFFDSFTLADGSPAEDNVSIETGWTYVIGEYMFGSVLRWSDDDQRWTPPTGDDIIRPFVLKPEPFRTDPRYNLEDILTDYGTVMPDDIGWEQVFKELFWSINLLQWTLTGFRWVTRADPTTAENNTTALPYACNFGTFVNAYYAQSSDQEAAQGVGYNDGGMTVYSVGGWNSDYSELQSVSYAANGCCCTEHDEEAIPPQRQMELSGSLLIRSATNPSGIGYDEPFLIIEDRQSEDQGTSSYSYAQINGVSPLIGCTVDCYAFSTIDPDDHDQGTTVTLNGNPPDDGSTGHGVSQEYDNATYTFDAGTSSAIYRAYALVGSVTPDSTGNAPPGPLFGDTNPANKYPDSMAAPTGGPGGLSALSRAPESFYRWGIINYKGFIVSKTAAVARWDFKYVGPYSS